MLKVMRHVQQELQRYGFTVKKQGWQFNPKNTVVWFALKETKLSSTEIKTGPPLDRVQDAAKFKKMYKKTFVKTGKLNAKVKRLFTQPKPLIQKALRSSYVKEKVKTAKVV